MSSANPNLLIALAVAAACILATGCASTSEQTAGPPRPNPADPPYGSFVERYNERVAPFDRLWARAKTVVRGRDAEGKRLRESAEGHLQMVRPDKLALSLGKLGETYLYMGSDPTHYWWFDMVDSDNKVAWIGRHALINDSKARELGLPIRPLELFELAGIMPLPEDPGYGSVRWVNQGRQLLVSYQRGGRSVEMELEPARLEPVRVFLLNAQRRVIAQSDLSDYEPIAVSGEPALSQRAPTRIVITEPGVDMEIRLDLSEPTNRTIRPLAFDLAALLDVYRIPGVIDLDRPRDPAPDAPFLPDSADTGASGDQQWSEPR